MNGTKISLSEMRAVLEYDVNHIYFTTGDKLRRQTCGIPMGSPASPAMAVAVCAHAEHHFQIEHPEVQIHQGFRFIDDVLLFLKEYSALIGSMYPPPMELEEEEGILQGDEYRYRFLEAWSVLNAQGELDIIHHHKNTHRERHGLPPLKDVAHFSTHVPAHQKFGRVVGALNSAWHHSVGEVNKQRACLVVLKDMQKHGMPDALAWKAMNRMAEKAQSELWPAQLKPDFFPRGRGNSAPFKRGLISHSTGKCLTLSCDGDGLTVAPTGGYWGASIQRIRRNCELIYATVVVVSPS